MSAPARRAKVERTGADLSVRRQCQLLDVARSGVYRPRPEPSAADLALMRRIDELYLEKPFYGSRRMTFDLNEEGRGVNRKRVQRLMRLMGLEGLVPRPGTSKAAPGNKIYPCPLCGVTIIEPNHVWASDITTFRWRTAFFILLRSSTGPAARCWPGGCRTRWTARSASKRWRKLRNGTANRGYQRNAERIVATTPTKARNSPAPRSPASWRPPGSRFRWTDAVASWTTSSSSGFGARSNRPVDGVLQPSAASPGPEQPTTNKRVARRLAKARGVD
jgi:HTH-like domain